MNPIDYAAQTLNGVLAKITQLDPKDIGDVICGCAFALRELNMNAGRLIVNRAGLPDSIPGRTVNRFPDCRQSLMQRMQSSPDRKKLLLRVALKA